MQFRLRFLAANPAWAARFEPLLIQIGVGHNPRIQARVENGEVTLKTRKGTEVVTTEIPCTN